MVQWAIAVAVAGPAEGWLDAVVRIEQGSATCAGVRVDPARIATAYHCVAPGGRPLVVSRDGSRAIARVTAVDRADDLAILRVTGEGPTLPLGTAPALGSPVWALGHPDGEEAPVGLLAGTLQWSMSAGSVSAVGGRVLQITTPLNPGNSGGPVVDEDGRVVGIVSRRLGGEGLGFAIRSELVAELLQREGGALPPLGGTVAAELVLHGQTGEDALVAVGARLEVADRDRWVASVTGSVPLQPQWTAARFGASSSVVLEAATGPRLRLARGPWAVRLDAFAGAALLDRWTRPRLDPLDVSAISTVAWEVGGALAVRRVALEVAALPGTGLGRASIVLRWPGVFAVW